MYEDKTLVCKDCGSDFIFTAGEQEFYAEKGFENEPLRCPDCRKARKESFKNKFIKNLIEEANKLDIDKDELLEMIKQYKGGN